MILTFLAIFSFLESKEQSHPPKYLGIHPKFATRYTGSTFTCFDGSKEIPISSVNDGYCDCPDGSDEPSTSACLHGRFWCNNANSNGYYISSSSVNDGISDCCDESDEQIKPATSQYAIKKQCKHTADTLTTTATSVVSSLRSALTRQKEALSKNLNNSIVTDKIKSISEEMRNIENEIADGDKKDEELKVREKEEEELKAQAERERQAREAEEAVLRERLRQVIANMSANGTNVTNFTAFANITDFANATLNATSETAALNSEGVSTDNQTQTNSSTSSSSSSSSSSPETLDTPPPAKKRLPHVHRRGGHRKASGWRKMKRRIRRWLWNIRVSFSMGICDIKRFWHQTVRHQRWTWSDSEERCGEATRIGFKHHTPAEDWDEPMELDGRTSKSEDEVIFHDDEEDEYRDYDDDSYYSPSSSPPPPSPPAKDTHADWALLRSQKKERLGNLESDKHQFELWLSQSNDSIMQCLAGSLDQEFSGTAGFRWNIRLAQKAEVTLTTLSHTRMVSYFNHMESVAIQPANSNTSRSSSLPPPLPYERVLHYHGTRDQFGKPCHISLHLRCGESTQFTDWAQIADDDFDGVLQHPCLCSSAVADEIDEAIGRFKKASPHQSPAFYHLFRHSSPSPRILSEMETITDGTEGTRIKNFFTNPKPVHLSASGRSEL